MDIMHPHSKCISICVSKFHRTLSFFNNILYTKIGNHRNKISSKYTVIMNMCQFETSIKQQ